MAELQNFRRLQAKLLALAGRAKKDTPSVVVGFTQNYAIYVHERTDLHHPVGQAKFLEQPARQLSNDGTLGAIVSAAMREKKTMAQGLLLAGLRLQRESQHLTPVDTGALKGSAFTELE